MPQIVFQHSKILGLGGRRGVLCAQIIHHLSASCNQIFEVSPSYLMPPNLHFQLSVCLSTLAPLLPVRRRLHFKSSVHIWDSPSAVCRDLTPSSNLTPWPSLHISNPQWNCRRAPTQTRRLQAEHGKTCATRHRRRARSDRVWRRPKTFSDGCAKCKITA